MRNSSTDWMKSDFLGGPPEVVVPSSLLPSEKQPAPTPSGPIQFHLKPSFSSSYSTCLYSSRLIKLGASES